MTIWGFASAAEAAREREKLAESERQLVVLEKTQVERSRQREARISSFLARISSRAHRIDEQFARSEEHVRGLADTARLLLSRPAEDVVELYSNADFADAMLRKMVLELVRLREREVPGRWVAG